MPYLTPDNRPTERRCKAIFYPIGREWDAILSGALQELTFPWNWETFGACTVQEAVEAFTQTFNEFCLERKACRVIGEIIPFAGSISPDDNWFPCDGRSLNRADFPDLFTVIGTAYGSSSSSTFNLPDLRGRTMVSIGQGNGLDNDYVLGQTFGEDSHTLTVDELATHNHADSGHYHSTGNSSTALAVSPGELPVLIPNPVPSVTGSASANIGNTGSGEAHENRQPSIAVLYLIVVR